MNELFDTMGGGIGAVVILSALVSCIIACVLVVIDTGRDTIREVRSLLKKQKNKKLKN